MPGKGSRYCGKSMAYKIVKTDSFQRDLDAAVAYIASSLENKSAARSLLDAAEKVYDNLEHMPFMYEACRDPYLHGTGFRKAVVHNYVIIYKVDEEQETVYILRLFHGRQDYVNLL